LLYEYFLLRKTVDSSGY